jgi:hypothetical protein
METAVAAIVGVAKATLGNGMRPDGSSRPFWEVLGRRVMSRNYRATLDRQRRIPKGVT